MLPADFSVGAPAALQALHRTHAAPSGAFLSGDPSVGFSLHFQAPSSDKAAAEKLQRFMTICNGGSQAIAFGTNAYQHIMSRGECLPGPACQGTCCHRLDWLVGVEHVWSGGCLERVQESYPLWRGHRLSMFCPKPVMLWCAGVQIRAPAPALAAVCCVISAHSSGSAVSSLQRPVCAGLPDAQTDGT